MAGSLVYRETGVMILVLERLSQHVPFDVIEIGFSWACYALLAEMTLHGNTGSSM